MKFSKTKMPKPLYIKGLKEPVLYVAVGGTAIVKTPWPSDLVIGPRQAVALSRWLGRYSKWSSVYSSKENSK